MPSSKAELSQILLVIQQDEEWVKKHNFQKDVVDNAWQRLHKRTVGWMTHQNVWKDDDGTINIYILFHF